MTADTLIADIIRREGGFVDGALCGVVATLVARLLRGRRPSAVAWGIGAERVDAVDCLPVGAHAHIRKEGFEAIPPPRVHCDALRPVVPVLLVIGVVASSLCGLPRVVGRSSAQLVTPAARSGHFPSQASAALGVPARQFVPGASDRFSAGATADPLGALAMAGRPGCSVSVQNNQAPVLMSRSIDEVGHAE
jgi:hypothetical protein